MLSAEWSKALCSRDWCVTESEGELVFFIPPDKHNCTVSNNGGQEAPRVFNYHHTRWLVKLAVDLRPRFEIFTARVCFTSRNLLPSQQGSNLR